MNMTEITQVIELRVSDPGTIGAYVTVLPDGMQIIRASLMPLEEITRELYAGYKRAVDTPVPYDRFYFAYVEAETWGNGVIL